MTRLWIMFGIMVAAAVLAVVQSVRLSVRSDDLEATEEELETANAQVEALRATNALLKNAVAAANSARYDAERQGKAETARVSEVMDKTADATALLNEAAAKLEKANQDVAYWKTQAEEARSANISSSAKAKTS